MSKKILLNIAAVLLLAAVLTAVSGCRPGPGASRPEEEPVRPVSSSEKRDFKSRTGTIRLSPTGPEDQVNILLLGFDAQGVSDAIVLLTYNNVTFDAAMISIKRITHVDFQTWSEKGMGHDAICWASYAGMGYGGSDYLGGARLAAETTERLLGVPIHAYAAITFEGFKELINQIGGVVVDVAPGFAGTRLTPGVQRLYGEEALRYARHRKEPRVPEPGSDTTDGDRIRRNQRLLQAVLEQCRTFTTDELLQVYEALNQKLHTNLDDWDLMILANIFFHHDLRLVEQLVLPGEHRMVYESGLDMELEYYFLDFEACDEIFTRLGMK